MCADSPSQGDTFSLFMEEFYGSRPLGTTTWAPTPPGHCLSPGAAAQLCSRGWICFQTDVPEAKYKIPGVSGRERTSSFYVNVRAWFERTKPVWSSASRLSELPSEQRNTHTFFFFFWRAGPCGPSLGRTPSGGFPVAWSLQLDWEHHLSHSTSRNGFYRILTHL